MTTLSRAQFAVALLLVVLVATGLRVVFPVADPPARPTVGVVWHDEGAWVHNARNRALFGAWRQDEWNPMYMTPVLTGLEYVSFRLFGVGLAQARLVSEALGVLSVWLIGLGVARAANRLAGLIAAALLATNYVYVMYDRAATMEATMVAFLVVAWYGYARAQEAPRWGLLAGAAAITAYFAKASAVFFVAALGVDALLSVAASWPHRMAVARSSPITPPLVAPGASVPGLARRAGLYTLGGVALAGALAAAFFLVPNWREYQFYNWQISVTRKPVYTLKAFADRASGLPLTYDFFTRMWPMLVVAVVSALTRLARWSKLGPAERLLLLWAGFGVAELALHDAQDRRLVFLIPALVALAAIALGRDRSLAPVELTSVPRTRALLAAPVVCYAIYFLVGVIARVPFLYAIDSGGHPAPIVRTSAVIAIALGCMLYAAWPWTSAWLARHRWSPAAAVVFVALVAAGDLAQFGQWAAGRSYKNYEAMRLIGQWLPPGTLVHGKLANGLALENRIRPVFVGNGFGNYVDRLERDDIRYLVTYLRPLVGYEGRDAIRPVLEAYPNREVIRTYEVSESAAGDDLAALIDKHPERRGNKGGRDVGPR
jgi:hypothetical protein